MIVVVTPLKYNIEPEHHPVSQKILPSKNSIVQFQPGVVFGVLSPIKPWVLPKHWKTSGFHEGLKQITFIDWLPTVTVG